jgi:hypothetical protein
MEVHHARPEKTISKNCWVFVATGSWVGTKTNRSLEAAVSEFYYPATNN